MGYSISAAVKNKEAQDRMLDFLDRTLIKPGEPFSSFLNDHWVTPLMFDAAHPGTNFTRAATNFGSLQIASGDRLAYGTGRFRIGYNYGPIPSFERDFRWALVTWIALKAGKRRFFPSGLGGEPALATEKALVRGKKRTVLPFVCWDDEANPVVPLAELKTPPKGDEAWAQHLVDNHGVPIGTRNPQWTVEEILCRIPIKDFIGRLERAWKKENPVPSTDGRFLENLGARNVGNPVIPIPHGLLQGNLPREGSAFKADCPFCGQGVFLVSRSQTTGKLLKTDRCILCGQGVLWTDAVARWGADQVEP